MVRNRDWVNHAVITIDGNTLPSRYSDSLLEVSIDTTLHLPTMFVMRFLDENIELLDEDVLLPGKEVEIKLGYGDSEPEVVVNGEITAVEPDFTEELTMIFTVRGFDRAHRLNRSTRTRVFVQMKDSDIVREIANDANLTLEVDETTQVHDHVFQDNQTDLGFLQERAQRLGFEVFVDDKTLVFRASEGRRGNVPLIWGDTLRRFQPRLTLARQVDEVTVKGWDPTTKKEIIGQAQRGQTATKIKIGDDGGTMASEAFSSAQHIVVRRPIRNQAEADTLAQSMLNTFGAEFVEAEGIAQGNPVLVAGHIITVDNIGSRFSGDYMVTAATHTYSQDDYDVYFRVEGAYTRTMADLVSNTDSRVNASQWMGVFPAVVTNNKDPREMGRIKLKFPWLDDQLQSDWARIVSIGSGANRGIFWLPEVNDEVLVGFEHGDFNHPYVIGNLWNGEDKPPEEANNIVGSTVNVRTIQSRSGHVIRFSEEEGDNFIEIQDASGANLIKFDTQSQAMQITSNGNVTVSAGGDAVVEAVNADIIADANITIDAGAQLTIKGAIINVESSGILTLKGSMVQMG